jgi:hypothetical protein
MPHTFVCPKCNTDTQSGYLLEEDYIERSIFQKFEEFQREFSERFGKAPMMLATRRNKHLLVGWEELV